MFKFAAPNRAAVSAGTARATLLGIAAATLGLAGISAPQAARASSHSDAPLIKLDPQANLTDVYAFVGTKFGSPGTPVLNIVVNVHPFCEPGDGAIYDKFSDDAIYSINITNPSTGAVISTYNFQFSATAPNGAVSSPGYKNIDTILSYGRGTSIGSISTLNDTTRNYTQNYSVSLVTGGNTTTLGSDIPTSPPNVGKKVTPLYNDANGRAISGATTEAGLDSLTAQAVTTLPGGAVVFAGPRDDSFFSDIPAVFDLLETRLIAGTPSLGQQGGGVDGFKGFNVLTYSIQIPLSSLPGPFAYADAFNGLLGNTGSQGVGVFASVSRPRITLRSATGPNTSSGPFIQVNRLGNPLFNEGLVALRDKDNFNRTLPINDAAYDAYARTPELAVLLNAVYGTSFQTNNRTDLVAVFIPDVLRVNTTTGAARLAGTSGFSRLGFIGGDTLTSPNGAVNGGWPNGRRFGDDVVDVALTAIASGPSYSTVTVVGDNVPSNDTLYNRVFPYAATPNSGTNNQKDTVPAVGY